ncbi:cell envelope integrity protein TolA [Pseudoxanthomonas indica]|uniref:Cell division and transport-associated protein TolA n=1 Tax=Pseudoxanthomonas indica TaxID=428993 RepID=A0A1T5LH75_9GAMM|nr:cell envelope integrity protein TolA [Pseudoxanthomonas indica]GGD35209.1 protein TolA [Pseudoxanthomonas indica]SKC75343.1 Cell division and transport-associated protein TolA [Pseudoxanthomonas indica]
MHADAFPRRPYDEREDWKLPIALAIGVHLLLALLFVAAYLWSPSHDFDAAAGSPVVEASLVISSADVASAQQAMRDAPKPPEPLPTPVEDVAEEDTVPPPQPLPEPRPQDSPVAPQQQAQERIPVPDTTDQDAASKLAIAQEKALKEQEEKRRQEQIDLTERDRQQEAERKARLAKQQLDEDREKKLADIRKRREQAAREVAMAEQKNRQLQNVQQQRAAAAAAASSTAATSAPSAGQPGQGGTSDDLAAKYAAAIQAAVSKQWIRPDSVPLGQRCRVTIRQLPGGEVIDAKVDPSCPYDEAGRRSVEAAVLRAQPLPYRGFESVFQRTLNFTFQGQDR